MVLYFAYGSNMNQAQMRERCPGAKLLGAAELKDYKLAMTVYSPIRLCGCADVIQSPGDSVYGLLYQLTREEQNSMDSFEGVPIYYRRITVDVNKGGEMIKAYTYEVIDKKENLKTSKEYLGLLQAAAREFTFPREYQSFLESFQRN